MNPSLLELEEDEEMSGKLRGDAIGSTLYSERWMLKIIMKITEEYPNYCQMDEASGVTELEKELDDLMCQLWDTTTEVDVANFLMKHKILDLLVDIIMRSQAPRLTEISVGLIGNLSCHDDVRKEILRHSGLVPKLMLDLLGNTSDVPTLLAALRFIQTCFWHLGKGESEGWDVWLPLLKDPQITRNRFCFILSSCTNGELLHKCSAFLYSLVCFEMQEQNLYMSEYFAHEDFVEAALEAMKQLLLDNLDNLEVSRNFLGILSSLLKYPTGQLALALNASEINEQIKASLNLVDLKQISDNSEDGDWAHILNCVSLLTCLVRTQFHSGAFLLVIHVMDALKTVEVHPEKSVCDVQDQIAEYYAMILRNFEIMSEFPETLEQCHVHQVTMFFSLVAEKCFHVIQGVYDYLKQTNKHNRLVEILGQEIKKKNRDS